MDIKYLIIHCSATPPSLDIGVETIRDWHVKDRGWSDVGYHYIIRRDGTVEKGRPDNLLGAHVRGYNSVSLGICIVGGLNEEKQPDANYTASQWESLKSLIDGLKMTHSSAEVCGHRDMPGVNKDCPCFDAISWYSGG